MMKFKCKLCDHEFESTEHRPMCPQGCKLDRLETSRPDDFSTAVRDRTDDPAKRKPAKRKPAKRKPAKRKPAKRKKEDRIPQTAFDSAAGRIVLARDGKNQEPAEPPELPENKAPESTGEQEVQENEANSLDNGENP